MGPPGGVSGCGIHGRAGPSTSREAAGVGVLEPGQAPQLHLRDPECPLLVIAGYEPGQPTIPLYHLPRNFIDAPNYPGRGQVPPEVWERLDGVLSPSTGEAFARDILARFHEQMRKAMSQQEREFQRQQQSIIDAQFREAYREGYRDACRGAYREPFRDA